MIDEITLRDGLKRLLTATETDIRARVEEEPALKEALEARHKAAAEAGRTAPEAWLAFRDETVTQAAAHWLLSCVFVRFLEDNGLVEEIWLSGPKTDGRDRLNEALDRQALWYLRNPHKNDAGYLLDVFARTAELPGMAGLFDRRHNPLWSLAPTGLQAMAILRFFRDRDEISSELRHDFTDPSWSTRFLGDLYQNLSEFARKRYALCQTPGFVVDFILDRTLNPALDVFGLEQTRIIDPTCGSGHFLLAAFDRLFEKWIDHQQSENPRVLAQRALDAVSGVDLNPFAVEIAEFRLLIAALRGCGIKRLKDAPNFHFQLAAGDSLLHGPLLGRECAVQRELLHDPAECFYDSEDEDVLKRLLGRQYQVVIGNPPYITVDDPTLRDTYRARYRSCSGKYQLSVPFIQRFFDLTSLADDGLRSEAGFVGVIISNGFMIRSYGKTLVEDYMSKWDLTQVIDTSGVHLPGHGTATAMLFGRHRPPLLDTVRAVRGIRGEVAKPKDPARAPVWVAVVQQADNPGSQSKWLSVSDVPRTAFAKHPWSMGGGGASELRDVLDQIGSPLGSVCQSIGITCFTLADDVYFLPRHAALRHGVSPEHLRPMVAGEALRDWTDSTWGDLTVFPYDADFEPIPPDPAQPTLRYLWPARTSLANGIMFGAKTKIATGLHWYEFGRLTAWKLRTPLSITFSNVATHNHYVLDRGGKVFNSHAPLIKLSGSPSETDYLRILGALNRSVACFWLKQVCYNKGTGGISEGLKTEKWEQFHEYGAAALERFPMPSDFTCRLGQAIQAEAEARSSLLPNRLCASQTPSATTLSDFRQRAASSLGRMIALQEELDWYFYHLYGLVDEDLSRPPEEIPPLKLGERTFEIVMARQKAGGELETTWFKRHGSTPITELPAHWPEEHRRTVVRRLQIIATNPNIALIEQPEYKRRWNLPKWDDLEQTALEDWLLERMESAVLWADPELKSCSRLADLVRRDPEFRQVAELAEGQPDYDVATLVKRLVLKQSVPYLPILRYKPTGMEKRREWEKTWDLQRREDSGEKVDIPVPPKYRSADFQDATWWNLRGSLDVAKERFILYPGLETVSDSSPVIGWAGWDHLQQAQALNAYYQHAKDDEGWPVDRLKPVLAGLLEMLPWLKQWHNEPNENGDRMGDTFEAQVEAECRQLGVTVDSLKEWMPTRVSRAGRRRG